MTIDTLKDGDQELESRLKGLPAEKKAKILEILDKDKEEENEEVKEGEKVNLDLDVDIKEDDSRETKIDKIINKTGKNDEAFWKIFEIFKNDVKHRNWFIARKLGKKSLSLDTTKKLIKSIEEKKCSEDRLDFILLNNECIENVDREIIDLFVKKANRRTIALETLVQNIASIEDQKYLFDELLKIGDWQVARYLGTLNRHTSYLREINLGEGIDSSEYVFDYVFTNGNDETIDKLCKYFIYEIDESRQYHTYHDHYKLLKKLKEHGKIDKLEAILRNKKNVINITEKQRSELLEDKK